MEERGRPRERPGEQWTPQTVLRTLPYPYPPCTTTSASSNRSPPNPIPFFHLLERLKTTPRSGWLQVGIPHGESISDHMYRMAVMAMIPPPSLAPRLDVARCIAMALVHDMAECLVGDFTPRDTGVSKREKARREGATMEYIQGGLLGFLKQGSAHGGDLMGLFHEYEANTTLEARFVHDVDKLEMLLQVLEYERATGRRLDEFYHVVEEIGLAEMREWAGVVVQEREEFFAVTALFHERYSCPSIIGG
ncbi:hypothetical protein P170DRAFT_455264 [Aspergillus steynii IBT 23096]|uniref:5'-deoxynucleotidase n=1 Tax=Aspergillus steynii IBT 23096 TaxID=1392250 RepID=A0A2I2GDG0_9EURO|nr:uncharacterized protein P170DRAFT_455264 [Aspergillus steynii IBT 23096]PLB50934.1 hypothetical protein P170DRAFT_455264 [Aspergillus steynii IBT 23096]